jgi:hypothetical protein
VNAETPADELQLDKGNEPGALTSPFVRHLVLLVFVAVDIYLLATALPVGEQPLIWFAGAAALGTIAALIARGWLGLLFLLTGLGAGLLVELHWRLVTTERVAQELSANGEVYLGALVAGALGFAVPLLFFFLGRRQAR